MLETMGAVITYKQKIRMIRRHVIICFWKVHLQMGQFHKRQLFSTIENASIFNIESDLKANICSSYS